MTITFELKRVFAFCFQILKANRKVFNIIAGFWYTITPSYRKFRPNFDFFIIFWWRHKMGLGTSHVIKLATIVQFYTMILCVLNFLFQAWFQKVRLLHSLPITPSLWKSTLQWRSQFIQNNIVELFVGVVLLKKWITRWQVLNW